VPRPYWHYDPSTDPECKHAQAASEIAAPSLAILNVVRSRWDLEPKRLAHVPYVFDPPAELLTLPVSTATGRITYLGRLEARKGVIELAEAMRLVLGRAPATKFRLVGRSLPHPSTGEDLAVHMRRLLRPFAESVEFVEGRPYSEIPRLLGDTDICVFPSVWESVGFVCLEAMAAGRGVVASGGSGMAELIDSGRSGRLVSPRDHRGSRWPHFHGREGSGEGQHGIYNGRHWARSGSELSPRDRAGAAGARSGGVIDGAFPLGRSLHAQPAAGCARRNSCRTEAAEEAGSRWLGTGRRRQRQRSAVAWFD
jgi:hypothetical protein